MKPLRDFMVSLLLGLSACESAERERPQRVVPDDFVVVNEQLANVSFDIRYFGSNNFVGAPVDGYQAPVCLLHKDAAEALGAAARAAQREAYRLKIFDCYRPQQAVDHFVRWANDAGDIATKETYYPRLNKSDLLGPYIAARSGHSRGASLDLTLERQLPGGDWQAVAMGTPFDFFDRRSNTFNESISDEVLENRKRLIRFMAAGGFVNYDMEWWHFSHPDQPYPDTYFDFPVVWDALP